MYFTYLENVELFFFYHLLPPPLPHKYTLRKASVGGCPAWQSVIACNACCRKHESSSIPCVTNIFAFPKNNRIFSTIGIICLLLYLLGFTMVQNSGNYWLQLIDDYCSGIPLLVIALVECLSLSYIYGMPRYL